MSDDALHAELGLSNKRWVYCAGSVEAERGIVDVSSPAAIDGTGSHILLEDCIKSGVNADSLVGTIVGTNHRDNPMGWLINPDRAIRVQMALDYIGRRVTELTVQFPGCTVSVQSEQRSNPGGAFGRDNWWGTLDISIIAQDLANEFVYFIEIADFKDGKGYVSEKDNSQLVGCLFGKLRPSIAEGAGLTGPFIPSNVSGCRMTIIQPKTNPVIRYCEPTIEEVIASARVLAVAACKTDKPNAPRTAGKHCQWCRANPKRGGICTAKAEESVIVMEGNMDLSNQPGVTGFLESFKLAITDPTQLTPDQLSELSDAEEGISATFKKVRDEIESRIESGVHVNGYDMRPGNGSNSWADSEEDTVKKLKSRRLTSADIYPKKLASPAAILKNPKLNDKQREGITKDLVEYKPGKNKLTRVARDVAPELTPSIVTFI